VSAVLVWLAVAATIGAVLGAHMVWSALGRLRVTHVDVPVAELPPALEGYTMAVLADLHYLPGVGLPLVRRAFELAHAARPDLVVLLGDYGISWPRSHALNRWAYARLMTDVGPSLRALAAERPTVAVLGNHDHLRNARGVAAWLEAQGARLLRNDACRVAREGAELVIVGLGDEQEDTIDVDAAYAGQPAHAPTVVLAHNPDSVRRLDGTRRADVVLSGHTHGGQIVLPIVGAPVTHSEVCTRHAVSGWIPNAWAPLFVSRGVGAQIPLRLNCPAEVVIIRLVRR
jgi:predicted MPP superfamily phosphohydrolase